METQIIKLAKEILNTPDVFIKKRLIGGMSNYTYVIEANGVLYTFRYPGEYSEFFVDRNAEKNNLALMETLGITNKTIYLNTESGIKIAEYEEGCPLSDLDGAAYPYGLVSEKLKIIHNSALRSKDNYNPFSRLLRYENYIKELGYAHPDHYVTLKREFMNYKVFLESQPLTLTHGDSQPSNFIYHDNNVVVVDFEFCANNDPLYDIACFSNKVYEEGLKLLHTYFENPGCDEQKRFHLWRAFQCLQWYNVAVFKDLRGMSTTLKINFRAVAAHYLELVGFYLEKTRYL